MAARQATSFGRPQHTDGWPHRVARAAPGPAARASRGGPEGSRYCAQDSAMCPRVTEVYTRRARTHMGKNDERALEARPSPPRTEDDAAPRRADPRRSHLRTGDALLPDLLAIPDPDGLGGDPRRHDVPAPPVARVPAGREAGMGVHADYPSCFCARRGTDGPAGGFAGRRRAEIRARRPGQHPADSGSAPGRGKMADRRQGPLCVLVEGTLRPSGTRAEHAAERRSSRCGCWARWPALAAACSSSWRRS